MVAFRPRDVTAAARAIAEKFPTERTAEGRGDLPAPRVRQPSAEGLEPHNAYGHFRITATEPQRLVYGRHTIDLSDLEQIVDPAQTRAIGRAIHHASARMDGATPLREIAAGVLEALERDGLDLLDPDRIGNLAIFRALDFAAALNRVRGLVVVQRE